jgi:hypothetical protein
VQRSPKPPSWRLDGPRQIEHRRWQSAHKSCSGVGVPPDLRTRRGPGPRSGDITAAAAPAATGVPRQSPPTGMRHLILGSASALPGGVAAKCLQEVDLAERGPVGVAEVELGVHGLPEQEVGHALLPAGSDDQVGVGLPGRV